MGKELQKHQWKKGQSGNPGGRPKTRPFRAALLAELKSADDPDALRDIARQLLEKAKSGDNQAIALLADRLEGKAVSMPSLELDTPLSQMNSADALGAIADAVSDGLISPQEGQQFASLIESRMKAIELAELDKRLTELEQRP